MRTSRVEVDNFLSFQHLALPKLDGALNVIVGPNGAGKSNLIRAFRMVCDVLDIQARGKWQRITYEGNRDKELRVRIDLRLTEMWERELLAAFVQAVLATLEVPETLLESHLQWIDTFPPAAIEELLEGTLEVSCSGGTWWTVIYRFVHEGAQYQWLLDGAQMLGIVRGDPEPGTIRQGRSPLADFIHPDMRPEDELRVLNTLHQRPFAVTDILPERGEIIQRLEVSTFGSAEA